MPNSDAGNKFIEKPWNESIGRSVLLDLMNAHFKHLLGEFHEEITQETLDRIFGKNSNLSREMLVFENEVGEIIGFTGISDISGTSPSWR